MRHTQMEHMQQPKMEVVGIFDDADELSEAVHELETEFPRHSFSVLDSAQRLKETTGHRRIDPKMANHIDGIPKKSPIYPEEKTIGFSAIVSCTVYISVLAGIMTAVNTTSITSILMAVLVAAIFGFGLGMAIASMINVHYQKDTNRQIKAGGLPLWISAPTRKLEAKARAILKKHGAHDIESYPNAK